MAPTNAPLRAARCKLLGVRVTPVQGSDLLDALSRRLLADTPTVVLGHNLHSAYLYHTDQEFRDVYDQAEVVLMDGAPVAVDRLLSGGKGSYPRLGSTDWLPAFRPHLNGKRVLVVGTDAETNAKFVSWLEAGGARARGVPGTDWSPQKEEVALAEVRSFTPEMLIVGLGMGRQEEFIARAVDEADARGVIAAVGGAIDQLVGTQRNAPRWMGKFGLEWLWRLATQPRRLAGRYLVEPWKLLAVRIKPREDIASENER